MFFKRLMGTSPSNHGEVVNQVKDNLWQATPSGTLFWLVEPDLCQSSTGVYFRKSGLNVYGSDGTWYSSLDLLDERASPKRKNRKVAADQGAHGCLVVLLVLGLLVWVVIAR